MYGKSARNIFLRPETAQRDVENAYEKFPIILKAILRGYDSVAHLTAEEKQAVYYVLCSIQMICVASFESVNEYMDLAKTNREMLHYIISKKQQINNIFLGFESSIES